MLSDEVQVLAVSVAGAAALMRLPENYVRDAINQGELPAMRFGRRIRINPVDLELWAIGCRLFSASAVPAS